MSGTFDPFSRRAFLALGSRRAFLALGVATALRGELAPARRRNGSPALRGGERGDPSDEALRAAFARQPAEAKKEIAEWFSLEARGLAGFYADCTKVALALGDRDRFAWPERVEPTWYDPEVHAPGAAKRRLLREGSSRVRSLRERFRVGEPARTLRSAWTYDHGTRELRRDRDLDDPERVVANAIAGYGPDHDYGEALVERALDDGSQSKIHAALGHLYTSRDGEAYAGITIYDAWCSGEEIEMPDVDCLGILHDVRDDWKSYVAPVPASQHDALYEEIEAMFVLAREHRAPREALARTFLRAVPEVPDGFGPHVGRFQALWNDHRSNPAALVATLPSAEGWTEWLESEGRRVDTDLAIWEGGKARSRALEEGAASVRATLARVMRDFGALGG